MRAATFNVGDGRQHDASFTGLSRIVGVGYKMPVERVDALANA